MLVVGVVASGLALALCIVLVCDGKRSPYSKRITIPLLVVHAIAFNLGLSVAIPSWRAVQTEAVFDYGIPVMWTGLTILSVCMWVWVLKHRRGSVKKTP